MTIQHELEKLWEEKYEAIWRAEAELSTVEYKIHGEPRLVAINNTLRDYYERNKKKQTDERQIGERECRLDNEELARTNAIPYRNLFFRINGNPSLKHHLFAHSTPHKPYSTAAEHRTIMDFVSETDFAVYQNLKGSGAGIPDHVHYQGQRRIHFPLLTDPLLSPEPERLNDQFELSYPSMIGFGALFTTRTQRGRDTTSQLIEKIGQDLVTNEGFSYNLIFDVNRVFFFPRTKETAENIPPQLQEVGMSQWQIAGQEMGYLFTAKYPSILRRLSWEILANTIKETTVTDTYHQQHLKDIINRSI